MLPLTPANNWTATVLFCGGTDLQPNQWMTNPNWNVAAYPADDTCVSITPDVSSEWVEEGGCLTVDDPHWIVRLENWARLSEADAYYTLIT
jgi:hypothetical protein